MRTDLEYLRRHYASLSDQALRAIDRTELTEEARHCYDVEVAQRKVVLQQNAATKTSAAPQEDPRWMEDGACVGSFVAYPGGNGAADADEARAALQAAGIPCSIVMQEIPPEDPAPRRQFEYRVMVPGGLNLKAVSVLDQEIYNPKLEADWRAHFEELSDEELYGLNPDVVCAGMQDRIERLRRAYAGEIARRRSR